MRSVTLVSLTVILFSCDSNESLSTGDSDWFQSKKAFGYDIHKFYSVIGDSILLVHEITRYCSQDDNIYTTSVSNSPILFIGKDFIIKKKLGGIILENLTESGVKDDSYRNDTLFKVNRDTVVKFLKHRIELTKEYIGYEVSEDKIIADLKEDSPFIIENVGRNDFDVISIKKKCDGIFDVTLGIQYRNKYFRETFKVYYGFNTETKRVFQGELRQRIYIPSY